MSGRFFFLLDGIVFFCILFCSVALRRWEIDPVIFINNCKIFLPIFLMTSFILWVFSFYDMKGLRKRFVSYKRLVFALTAAILFSATFLYFLSARLPLITPKAILAGTLILYFLYIYWVRKTYFSLDFAKPNLLIFGQSETIDDIVAQNKASRAFKLKMGGVCPDPQSAYSVRNLDMVVVGSKLFAQHPQAWPAVADKFIAKGALVDTDFNVYEHIFRRVSRESISDGMWLLRGIGNRKESSIYNMLKQTMDGALAVCLLPFLAPLGALIWVLIRVVDGCNPIFTQKRNGYLGKTITIYKFRTITPKTQESTAEQLTKTGAFLRRFRLDEIPQILNVLRGDISFVGPRPLWIDEWKILNEQIPNHSLRTLAKPGITGWAQLNFKAPPNYKTSSQEAHSYESAFTRFSYDVWYIKHRSILLDVEILIKTGLRMFIKDSYVAK